MYITMMDVALDFLEESGTHSIFIFLPPYRVYLFYVQPVPIFFFFSNICLTMYPM